MARNSLYNARTSSLLGEQIMNRELCRVALAKGLRSNFLYLLKSVTFAILLTSLVTAQEYRGRIQGIVSDTSGATAAGATVTLLNVATGVSAVRQTNNAGNYVFDLLNPGSYVLSVELSGFKKFVQEKIVVEARGDITINAKLDPGSVQESITVDATPVAVQFNSTSVGLTIDTKLANELPRFDRNPFKLSLLSPNAVNTRTEMNSYHSWAANSVDLGGSTSLKNDLLVDGSPIGIGHKATYSPPQDAVQEANILQSAVDAESGHSAGGAISMTVKSGTNEWHGNAWFLGRNPSLNAVSDRTVNTTVAERNNMYGGMISHPILKNRLFNFGAFEVWNQSNPINYFRTVPTALERQGDFSQSYNINGQVRKIYDPYSTRPDPDNPGQYIRTPFPDNKIPATSIDPVAKRLLDQLWMPNNAGDNITGLNNFKTVLKNKVDYWNFSDKVDYIINDKWRVSGRYSRLHTITGSNDPTPNNSFLYSTQNPSARHATSVVGDAVWSVGPTTVVNIHGDYHSLVDDYSSPRDMLGPEGLASIWPDNNWYAPFQRNDDLPSYYPVFTIGSSSFGGTGTYWYQHPKGYSFSAKLSQTQGSHYWKAGGDWRYAGGVSLVSGQTTFNSTQALTADTFNSPNTRVLGNEFASFLLGALDQNSYGVMKPVKKPRANYFGLFFQDDWKVTSRLTLNLGIRWEYETPWHDPDYQMSRGLNLYQPIAEMEANPPQVPGSVAPYLQQPWQFLGAWQFTDKEHPYAWNRQWNNFMPRAGLAFRIDNNTAVRFGYARYATPTEYIFIDPNVDPNTFLRGSGFEALNFLEPPYPGFDATQPAQGLLEGVPQASLSNPFPANKNPLIPPRGKDFGPYLGLGGSNLLWFYQNQKRPTNDRLSLSIQRQVPGQIIVDVTAFVNFGHDYPYTRNLNMVDPRLNYQYKTALQANVANPFYQYLDSSVFPGPSRNRPTVSIGSLLSPYPQYGGLYQLGTPGFRERYQSVQIQARRAFANGFNFMTGYAYIRERTDNYFNDIDNYENHGSFIESANPRHRVTIAGTLQLPFGRGRKYMSEANRIVDGVLGGWQLLGASYYNSGQFLRFSGMNATSDPVVDNPTPQNWFDTSGFSPLTPFTPRINPYQYSGLTGPSTLQIDATLSKQFLITERWKAELKMAAYNATNRLNRADPSTDVNSSTFGQTLRQRDGYFGRRLELGLKILF